MGAITISKICVLAVVELHSISMYMFFYNSEVPLQSAVCYLAADCGDVVLRLRIPWFGC